MGKGSRKHRNSKNQKKKPQNKQKKKKPTYMKIASRPTRYVSSQETIAVAEEVFGSQYWQVGD